MELPITSAKDALIEEIKKNQILIIVGETGSGKTTQIPQYIYQSGICKKGIIGITQPRRVAAISLAHRVTSEMKEKLGDIVGYSVRFDDKTNINTRVKFMTDGMLLRENLSDRKLSKYSLIILDEAHERSLRTDILLGMIKPLLLERKELKLIVMSATLDAEKFLDYFNSGGDTNRAKLLYVQGRQFPINIYYTKEPQIDFLDSALMTIFQIHNKNIVGDILVFLSGQEEIEDLERLIKEYLPQCPPKCLNIIVCTLFANLPSHKQAKVFEKTPKDCRKVILSTNIAETSITIPGVRHVIDTGVHKVKYFLPSTGMESLCLQEISKASAKQRAGRAGRENSGNCYRLYTYDTYKNLEETSRPEIQRCQMDSIILLLRASGVSDIFAFDFIDKPSRGVLINALETLYSLGAIDENQNLTSLGRKMALLPVDPKCSKMLIKSAELDCMEQILYIASEMSVESLFYVNNSNNSDVYDDNSSNLMEIRKKFVHSSGDHLTGLNVIMSFIANNQSKKWALENNINHRTLKTILDIHKQLKSLCNFKGEEINASVKEIDSMTESNILQALLVGYFHNTAIRVDSGSNQFKSLLTGQIVYIHPSSVLFNDKKAPAIVFNEMIATGKKYVKFCTRVEVEWIKKAAPHYFS